MAKHTTKAAATEGKPRPAPYTKSKETSANSSKGKGKSKPAAASTGNNTKARVEVRYEGAGPSTGSSSGKTTQKQTPGVVEVKAEPTEVDSTSAATPSTSAAASSSKPTPAARAPTTITQDSFVVIAGSYEKLLYGIEGTYPLPDPSADRKAGHNKDDGPERPTTRPVFIFPAHLAYVKCIAASPGGKWLATGSEDEFIKVWDLRRRKEVGSLSQHSGSITSLHFPSSAHLLSSSVDGTIALFRTSDWALLKSLKGHSGRVNHVDVHPTGRVALSVGKDQTLKMWDLMRGRGAASLALGQAEIVKFSPRGTHFAVLYPKSIQIYSLTLKLLKTLETKSRFNTLEFALVPLDQDDERFDPDDQVGSGDEVLVVGTEKGLVEVYSVDIGGGDDDDDEEDEEENGVEGKRGIQGKKGEGEDDDDDEAEDEEEGEGPMAEVDLIGTLVGHTNRIKCLSTLAYTHHLPPPPPRPRVIPLPGQRQTVLLSTVSSDGWINVYDLAHLVHCSRTREAGANTHKPVAGYDTKGSRLTCCFLADGKRGGAVVPVDTVKSATQGQAAQGDAKSGSGVTFMQPEQDEESEEEDDDEFDEEAEERRNMYEQDEDDESEDEEDDGMEVEFEDEEEEEDEDEEEME